MKNIKLESTIEAIKVFFPLSKIESLMYKIYLNELFSLH